MDAVIMIPELERVLTAVAPNDASLGDRIVSRRTLTRRRKRGQERLSAADSDRLVRLTSIWIQAKLVWGDGVGARDFLLCSHPLLNRRRPIDLAIESELGAGVVSMILGRLEYGLPA